MFKRHQSHENSTYSRTLAARQTWGPLLTLQAPRPRGTSWPFHARQSPTSLRPTGTRISWITNLTRQERNFNRLLYKRSVKRGKSTSIVTCTRDWVSVKEQISYSWFLLLSSCMSHAAFLDVKRSYKLQIFQLPACSKHLSCPWVESTTA